MLPQPCGPSGVLRLCLVTRIILTGPSQAHSHFASTRRIAHALRMSAVLCEVNMAIILQVLHLAVLRRNLPLVEELLDLGLPVSALSSGRWTPLDQVGSCCIAHMKIQSFAIFFSYHAADFSSHMAEAKGQSPILLAPFRCQ